MSRPSADVTNKLHNLMKGKKGAAPARGGMSQLMFNIPNALYLGMAGAKSFGRSLRDGTTISNPMYFRNIHSGYGKRGLDGDNLGTDGLVGGLHNKRRKS